MANPTDEEAGEDRFRRVWWGHGIAAITFFALCSSLLKFAPPIELSVIGLAAAATIMLIYSGTSSDYAIAGIVMLVVGALIGLFAFWYAFGLLTLTTDNARHNEARCLAIQHDMLSAHPRRSDGPDLFQALGCQPSGEGGVAAPPTDRERKAGHPLPWGGYPPAR